MFIGVEMKTKFIFISGAPNTGKSTTLKELYKFLKNTKKFKETKSKIIANDEGMFILEGYNNKGKSIKILINYPSDTVSIIDSVFEFYEKNKPFDIVITSIRDMYCERDCLLETFKINEDFIELPLAKVTRKNDKEIACKKYYERVFTLAKSILALPPFNL